MEALNAAWTNDPFDRIIVSQALANNATGLVTADTTIRMHYPEAVW
jgi:PIN domain nuclease of toxin-antitoxin system